MTPTLILALLVAALVAMLPVRQLHRAGWSSGALATSWVGYVAMLLVSIDAGPAVRYVLPLLIVLYVLPYVAGTARLAKAGRLLGARRAAPTRHVINVTPPAGSGTVEPPVEPAPKRRGRKPPIEYR